MLWLVELSGDMDKGEDKIAASERTYIKGFDAEDLLWECSRKFALDVVHLWDAPDVVIEYLKTGDKSLKTAARAAARDATGATARDATGATARDAARAAARDAAWATARDAARAAARDAAWATARDATGATARDATGATARDAARAAARAAAWDAARKKQRAYFARKINHKFRELGVEI